MSACAPPCPTPTPRPAKKISLTAPSLEISGIHFCNFRLQNDHALWMTSLRDIKIMSNIRPVHIRTNFWKELLLFISSYLLLSAKITTPHTLLSRTFRRFGQGFQPQNADRKYNSQNFLRQWLTLTEQGETYNSS